MMVSKTFDNTPALLRLARRFSKDVDKGLVDVSLFPEVRIALVGSYSIQHLALVLKYLCYLEGFNCEIYEGDYNSINLDILNMDSDLYKFEPQYVLILPYYTDIKCFPNLLADEVAINKALESDLDYFSNLWGKLKAIKNVQILQTNIVFPPFRQLNNFEGNVPYSRETFFHLINLGLVKKRPSNVTIVDLDHIASDIGKRNWFDYSNYFLYKSGFNINCIGRVAHCFVNLIVISKGKTKKCLVLDLDNTLWGGVVAEEGPLGIQLDPNNAIGEAFRFFQSYLSLLKESGIILAVCSKNDENIAKQPFIENPNMVLKLDDISCFVANWNDKAGNIRRIADELNIGIDSLVFFDDNPAERAIVSQMIPEVLVVDVPDDPALYVQALDDASAFDRFMLTAEDLSRVQSYQKNIERRIYETSFSDYNEYLKNLQMKARVGTVSVKERQRFVQLINKSNQFNLRTIRYSDSEIERFENDDAYKLLFVELCDRFDHYGIISCIILRFEEENCFIETWVMSCRVLKRQIENLVFKHIVKEAKSRSCHHITGEYIPTEKNKLVCHLLDDLGFSLIEEDKAKIYSFDLTQTSEVPVLNINEVGEEYDHF